MATARVTIDAVLGTVTSTAETVSSIVNSVNNSAKMLNDYVENARSIQAERIKKTRKAISKELLTDTMIRISETDERMEDYINSKPGREQRCRAIYQELQDEV